MKVNCRGTQNYSFNWYHNRYHEKTDKKSVNFDPFGIHKYLLITLIRPNIVAVIGSA